MPRNKFSLEYRLEEVVARLRIELLLLDRAIAALEKCHHLKESGKKASQLIGSANG